MYRKPVSLRRLIYWYLNYFYERKVHQFKYFGFVAVYRWSLLFEICRYPVYWLTKTHFPTARMNFLFQYTEIPLIPNLFCQLKMWRLDLDLHNCCIESGFRPFKQKQPVHPTYRLLQMIPVVITLSFGCPSIYSTSITVQWSGWSSGSRTQSERESDGACT